MSFHELSQELPWAFMRASMSFHEVSCECWLPGDFNEAREFRSWKFIVDASTIATKTTSTEVQLGAVNTLTAIVDHLVQVDDFSSTFNVKLNLHQLPPTALIFDRKKRSPRRGFSMSCTIESRGDLSNSTLEGRNSRVPMDFFAKLLRRRSACLL